jgi:diguanylate cyclase (GGDEF)-like protein/PAS domain S-box-containing protein
VEKPDLLCEIEEEARFKSMLLDIALDGIIAHTLDGEPVYFNEAAHTQLGYTREEFKQLGPWGWVAEKARPTRPRRMQALLKNGTARFSGYGKHKDGRVIPTEVVARLVERLDGPIIISVVRDITERVRAEEHMRYMAFHDQLTGLANRSLLEDHLAISIGNAHRYGDLLGIAYLDLDDFKQVNDAHGHAFGDQVLRVTAERLRNTIRKVDTAARIGGDEFVVVLPRLRSAEDLTRAGDKLLSAIAEPMTIDDRTVTVTGSVGVTLLDVEHDDARTLLMRADLAMYTAKRAGANRLELLSV